MIRTSARLSFEDMDRIHRLCPRWSLVSAEVERIVAEKKASFAQLSDSIEHAQNNHRRARARLRYAKAALKLEKAEAGDTNTAATKRYRESIKDNLTELEGLRYKVHNFQDKLLPFEPFMKYVGPFDVRRDRMLLASGRA